MSAEHYPNGRWTPAQDSISSSVKSQRIPLFAQPVSALLGAPLRDLFWGLPDSGLLEEARLRVEGVLAIALAKDATLASARQELALA